MGGDLWGLCLSALPKGVGINSFSSFAFLEGWGISTFLQNQMMIQEMMSFVPVDGQIIMKT